MYKQQYNINFDVKFEEYEYFSKYFEYCSDILRVIF